MSNKLEELKIYICPRCGGYVREAYKGASDQTIPYCDICGMKLVDTHYTVDQLYKRSKSERQQLDKHLHEKYVYCNPYYNPEMELKQIEIRKGEVSSPTLIKCPVCKGNVSSAAESCPHCGQPVVGKKKTSETIPPPVEKKPPVVVRIPESLAQPQPTGPRCPTCGSTDVRKLDVIDKGLSFAVWGIFSNQLGKSMTCKGCGYKW